MAKRTRREYAITDGVTQSLLSSWVDCRQRCRWYLDGWRADTLKEGLEYGSLFHFLLEELYERVRGGLITADVSARVDSEFWRGALERWRAKLPPTADAAATEQTEICIAQAAGVWDGYLAQYPQDFNPKRWIELEGVFDVTWNGYRLRGRRDGMLTFRRSPWLLETKTKSQITPGKIEAALAFDFQNLFYVTANQAELEARKMRGRLRGVKYNIVRKPQHKAKGDLRAYSGRIAKDVALRPDHFFLRYEATYAPDALREHQRQLVDKLAEFDRWLRGEIPTYRNEGACQKRWNCTYIDLCAGNECGYTRDGTLFEELA